MNLFLVDLSEPDGVDIFEGAVNNSSFFNEHRLIVCKNSFTKKANAELLLKYITEYGLDKSADTTLIAAENATAKEMAAKSKELFKILSDKKHLVKEVEPLQGGELLEWIKEEFKSRGCSIGTDAARNLVSIAGSDGWSLVNEIGKLTAYKTGEATTADIANLVAAKTDLSIFDLIDALGNKNRRRALELLYKELGTGREPYYILTMIIYQFRNILTVKDLQKRGLPESEIIRKSKLNPFVIKKIINNPFETTEAINLYNRLLNLDIGFKMGQLDLENSLYGIILS